ncbi:hypothetical protein BJ912DRAFT_975675 [Pholiota molesta]|nr:hypothetical protein BJ912DRAFT_975675 [Pholiota molesta]
MKSIFAPAAAALLLAGNALAQQLTINTPGPAVVCQPLLFTWTGGTPPYFLSIVPGNQPSAAALINFGQTTDLSQRWVVNITAGTTLGLNLRDNTGIVAQSGTFTTQASSDTSCLTGGGSTTSGSSSSGGSTTSAATTPPATTPPTNTPTAPITTAPGTSSVTTAGSTGSTTGTTTAPKTSTTSSATGNMANAGLVGAFGIGAALMALVF